MSTSTSKTMYPEKLQNIIDLFDDLPEVERRETLVSYADSAKKQEPRSGEQFDLEDMRKDEDVQTRLASISRWIRNAEPTSACPSAPRCKR